MPKPDILHQEIIAQSRLFRIERLELRFSNGVEVEYERLIGSGNSHGAVLVVPLLDDETVLLIREYAAGVHRYELALPKGRIEAGESPLEAANRELMEETGYGARALSEMGQLTLAPAYIRGASHIILARDLYPSHRTGDEPEPIEVIPWRLDNLSALLQHEECSEARSIAALFMTREHLLREH